MNPKQIHSDDHLVAIGQVVTTAMHDLAETLDGGTIASLISGCRHGAMKAMDCAKPELAAVFIRLGAELMATADDEVVIETDVANPSKAIALISAIA